MISWPVCRFRPGCASAPGTEMIKDAKSSGIGPIHAEYGRQALRITEMSSSTGLVLTGEIDEDTYPPIRP
jgi:hypothetical protein